MAANNTVTIYGTTVPSFIEKTPTSKKKVTYGLGFPLGSNRESGGFFTKKTGVELIKDAVIQLLRTDRGERILLPKFGCNLRKFLFQPLDETTFEAIKEEIRFSFYNYIVGARLIKLGVTPLGDTGPSGGNSLLVTLTLQIIEEDLAVFDVPVLIS